METPITYETSYKWALSIGTFLLIFSISIPLFKNITTNSLIIPVIGVTVSVILINFGLTEIRKAEDAMRRYNQELTISEIIKQDLLLMDKEIKELEYNERIKKWNRENLENQKQYKKFRDMEFIVRQALNPNFYEKKKTYLKSKEGEKYGE